MEISSIDKVTSVKKLGRGEVVHSSRIEDTLSISSEAQKKSEWVEMLKSMPDVRMEEIQGVSSDALSSNAQVLSAVSEKILNGD